MPSLAALIPEINDSWIPELGNWAQGTAAEYVRTHLVRVRFMQRKVAALSRRPSTQDGHLDEDEVYAKWARYLCDRGGSQAVAVDQVVKLTHFLDQERKKLQGPENQECSEDVSSGIDKMFAIPVPAIEDIPSRAIVSDTVREVPLGTYVVSIRGKSLFRRLHRVGDCPNTPGVHYLAFECLGTSFPSADKFDVRCRRRFGNPLPDEQGEESATSSGSSSES